MISRRRFVTDFVIALTPLGATASAQEYKAQPAGNVWRIGYLTPAEIPRATLIEALRELGYVEGQTVRLEVRSADNDLDRLPQLAMTLVDAKVDVIVAVSPPAIRAASQATRAIPVVMGFWGGEGLLESGIVRSFARPGANVTGIYMLAEELDAKRLELLLEAVPNAKRVALLNPGRNWGAFTEVRRVAQAAKILLYMTDVPGSMGYQRVFEAMAKEHVDALLVPSFPRFFREYRQIIEVAAKRGVPAMYEWGDMPRAGGLMAYGPVFAELNRRIFDAIFGQGARVYHTGGYLGDGEIVWLLARINKTLRVGRDDVVEPYALMANSHDGSMAFSIRLTTVRVVCQNTLALAMQERVGSSFRRPHEGSLAQHAEAAQEFFQATLKELDFIAKAFTALSAQVCREDVFRRIVQALLPEPKRPRNADSSPGLLRAWERRVADIRAARAKILDLQESGKGAGLDGARGTFWGALNAVLEYVDHYRVTNGSPVSYALLGDGMGLKVKAFRMIQEAAKAV